ncbi:MAG TPA: hypothetical protein VNK46_14020 [Nitrospiraceae bacterium]|jgi:hypothetical protein|nr:hypothetical protein [Nitrospiraceae bacterium]
MRRVRWRWNRGHPPQRADVAWQPGRTFRPTWAGRLPKEIEARWTSLHRSCADFASRARLTRLIDRLTSADRGVRESALAELELATLLIRANASVAFLPESQARTADLECVVGQERMFVEVTAMAGRAFRHRPALSLARQDRETARGQEGNEDGKKLIDRVLARVAQKAKQLADYHAPVLLAVSVPRSDAKLRREQRQKVEEVDLKLLAGTVTLFLSKLPQLSAVLLSLWEVEPMVSRSGIRLANVLVVERSCRQSMSPRVRVLITNPWAGFPMSEVQRETLARLL